LQSVRFIAQGTYEKHQGILVLTDVRLLFLFHGMVGQAKEDFPLRCGSAAERRLFAPKWPMLPGGGGAQIIYSDRLS